MNASRPKPSFLDSVRKALRRAEPVAAEDGSFRVTRSSLRLPARPLGWSLERDDARLHVLPDFSIRAGHFASEDLLVRDPDGDPRRLVRLTVGADLKLTRSSPPDGRLTDRRWDLRIRHEGALVSFKGTPGTTVRPLESLAQAALVDGRRAAARRLSALYGGPIEPLSTDEALADLVALNEGLRHAPHRPLDADGHPGALLELPDDLDPLVVGDLHGRAENLLSILCAPGVLHGLEHGRTALLLLGDMVHDEHRLEDMAGSQLVMDLLVRLAGRLPGRILMLVGNHESFAPGVTKAGVPQGPLWSKHLVATRGQAYRDQMATLYDRLPVMAVSSDLVACHAAPPASKVTRDALVNARHSRAILKRLLSGRAQVPGHPAGYSRGDVRRLRTSLGLAAETPFIVGHFPRDQDDCVWLDANHTPGHHVVYSSRDDRAGVFARIGGHLVAQRLGVEPISPWINAQGP